MAEQTTNFNLKKPAPEDFYSVEDFNGNMDILDAEIKEAQDKATQAFQSASDGKGKIKTAITGIDPSVTIPTDATFAQLATAIGQIKTGVDTGDAAATAEQILAGMTAYVKGAKVTGTIPSKTGALYYPSTSAQKIAGGQYLSGDQTIAATAGTAAAGHVLSGKTFNSASGIGLTGTMPDRSAGDSAALAVDQGSHNVFLRPAQGYWDGVRLTYANDPNYSSENILSGKSIFGLQGSIPVQGSGQNLAWSNANADTGVDVYPTKGYWDGSQWLYISDSNLIPGNILSGKSIFGVPGAAIAGKRWASGSGTTDSVSYNFDCFRWLDGPTQSGGCRVSGLTFTPSCIVIESHVSTLQTVTTYTATGLLSNPVYKIISSAFNFNVGGQEWQVQAWKLSRDAYVNSSGFLLPVYLVPAAFTWTAYE